MCEECHNLQPQQMTQGCCPHLVLRLKPSGGCADLCSDGTSKGTACPVSADPDANAYCPPLTTGLACTATGFILTHHCLTQQTMMQCILCCHRFHFDSSMSNSAINDAICLVLLCACLKMRDRKMSSCCTVIRRSCHMHALYPNFEFACHMSQLWVSIA